MEEKTNEKIEEVKKENKILVVKAIPEVQTRTGIVGDVEYDLVTTEEALTEILESTREIKKGLIGN